MLCECHHYTEDLESMETIFDGFLKLDRSTDALVHFESLLRELKAYDAFKLKKKKVMHLVLKTLDIATGYNCMQIYNDIHACGVILIM